MFLTIVCHVQLWCLAVFQFWEIPNWNPKQPFFNGFLVNHQFFHVMIWTHPIETTISKWMFRFPGRCFSGDDDSPWCHGSGPQTSAPLGWWESMTTRHGLVSNWSHFFQEVPLASFMAFPWDFLKKKTNPKNLGMLKKDSELICRSENCVFEKSWWLFIYVFICFFRKRCFKRFWEKNSVTMESMRCFYLDLCMWRICRSCLIRTRDSA